ncbi:hypothetical protein PC115_g10608 [Phytophthora cactorum]|uniref:Uncharacterized protein n=1 Tax=Phytophthora cactorum TaxID=29920 RepID=A0A8T1CAE7_9STRA|nr:hypothetical protein PC115_g10608 [Phytophthora cactorum]
MVADYEASVQCILYPRAYTGGRHKFISTGRASNGVGKLWTYERAAQKRPIAACEGGGESDVSQDDGWQSTSSAIAGESSGGVRQRLRAVLKRWNRRAVQKAFEDYLAVYQARAFQVFKSRTKTTEIECNTRINKNPSKAEKSPERGSPPVLQRPGRPPQHFRVTSSTRLQKYQFHVMKHTEVHTASFLLLPVVQESYSTLRNGMRNAASNSSFDTFATMAQNHSKKGLEHVTVGSRRENGNARATRK